MSDIRISVTIKSGTKKHRRVQEFHIRQRLTNYLLRIDNSVRVLQSSFADVHRSGIRRAPLLQQLYVRSYGTPIP